MWSLFAAGKQRDGYSGLIGRISGRILEDCLLFTRDRYKWYPIKDAMKMYPGKKDAEALSWGQEESMKRKLIGKWHAAAFWCSALYFALTASGVFTISAGSWPGNTETWWHPT